MSKYYRYLKYLKYINGVPQDEYKQGELIGVVDADSQEDCESGALYRWVITDLTICDGYDLKVKEKKQKSLDKGVTWQDTSEFRAGSVIEKWSAECGVVDLYRWYPTGRVLCKNMLKVKESIYLISRNMGASWENVQPEQYKYEPLELFSPDCLEETEPFTVIFDTSKGGLEFLRDEDYVTFDSQFYSWVKDKPNESKPYNVTVLGIAKIDWGDGNIEVLDLNNNYRSSMGGYLAHRSKSVNSHTYDHHGVYTIKMYGNINKIKCRLIDKLVSWGQSMYSIELQISHSKSTDTNGQGVYSLYNFETVNILRCYLGTDLGNYSTGEVFHYINSLTLNAWDELVTFPDIFKYCPALHTLNLSNNKKLRVGPNLTGNEEYTYDLRELYLTNCPNLIIGPTFNANFLDYTFDPRNVLANSLNVEELPLGNVALGNSASFTFLTKLRKISGNLAATSSGASFYEICRGMTSLIDILGLRLWGGTTDYRYAFLGCTNLKNHCTISVGSRLNANLQSMFANTGITEVNINTLFLFNVTDPQYKACILNEMFELCPNLKSVTGYFDDLFFRINEGVTPSTDHMFDRCTSLTSISPMFLRCTYLPSMGYMFNNCTSLTSVPSNLFGWKYDGTNIIYPNGMFNNCYSLTNYPIIDEYPMWRFPAFYKGTITETLTFKGCNKIIDNVPPQWGGILGLTPTRINVRTSQKNEIVQYDEDPLYSNVVMRSSDAVQIDPLKLEFIEIGDYTVNIYNAFEILIPELTIDIINWGDVTNIRYLSESTGLRYLPYGDKLFLSVFEFYTYSGELAWFENPNINSVANKLLLNCGNVSTIDGTDTLGAFNLNLSEEKYETIFNNLTNLAVIHYLFKKPITSTCGIFKHNPNLYDISFAFASLQIPIKVDELDNCPSLENVSSVFTGNTTMTVVPSFNNCKKIKNFSFAFDGCSNLTGSTPVDENGYKLWERAGKTGYPSSIDGQHCFRGCTLLDDYDQIPEYWK